MILKTAEIKNFKSINDSTEFTIDEKVTCLVGKNESGKTAILRCIGKLNTTDVDAADFDILEYPRRYMMEYQQRAETESAEALTTTWALTPRRHCGLGVRDWARRPADSKCSDTEGLR